MLACLEPDCRQPRASRTHHTPRLSIPARASSPLPKVLCCPGAESSAAFWKKLPSVAMAQGDVFHPAFLSPPLCRGRLREQMRQNGETMRKSLAFVASWMNQELADRRRPRQPSKKFRRLGRLGFLIDAWAPIHPLAGAHPSVTVPDAAAAWSVIRIRSVVVRRRVVRPCRDCAPNDSTAYNRADHRSGTPPTPPRFCFT
jgi:hypothetical protein